MFARSVGVTLGNTLTLKGNINSPRLFMLPYHVPKIHQRQDIACEWWLTVRRSMCVSRRIFEFRAYVGLARDVFLFHDAPLSYHAHVGCIQRLEAAAVCSAWPRRAPVRHVGSWNDFLNVSFNRQGRVPCLLKNMSRTVQSARILAGECQNRRSWQHQC